MEQKHIVGSVLLLAIIVIGMFVFAYLKRTELKEEVPQVTTPVVEESPYAYITQVDAKHFFDGKIHTLVGEVLMPTPCDLLTWETSVAESMPEVATVQFEVINDAEMCAQVMTPQRFKVSFDASKDARIQVLLNGRELSLNLIPALPGESPDDFEIFIKG